MAIILCLETATKVCSVALFSDDQLLGYQEYHIEKSHSNLLPSIIESTLDGTSFKKEDINAVAVSEGPGSYTGLRIGTSTAKGLCYSLEVPLLGINTLYTMAAEVNSLNYSKALLCPMIDARRMEVYACVIDSEDKVIQETAPFIIDENSFSEFLVDSKVLFFGDGSGKCRKLLEMNRNAVFVDHVVPTAKSMGRLAWSMFARGVFRDLAYFEPFYLKEFRATKPKSVN